MIFKGLLVDKNCLKQRPETAPLMDSSTRLLISQDTIMGLIIDYILEMQFR